MYSAGRLLIAIGLLVHPGGLDSKGGHQDRRNGGYHYHSSSGSAPTMPPAPAIGIAIEPLREGYRREARTTVRTESRVEARVQAPREQKATLPISVTAPNHEFRTWSDVSGRFTVIARFAGYTGGRVRLIKQDVSEIKVDVEVLSDADKSYLRPLLTKNGLRPTF